MFSSSSHDASPLAADNVDVESKLINISQRAQNFSDAQHLPSEILSIIFLLVRSQSLVKRHFTEPSECNVEPGPYLFSAKWVYITHVCRRWREVALGCPFLWTDVDIRVSDACSRWRLGFVEALLKYSCKLPLVVQISGQRPMGYIKLETKEEVTALALHAPRIKELYMFTWLPAFQRALADVKLPHLRVLAFCPSLLQSQDADIAFIVPSSINYLSLAGYEIFSKYHFCNLKQLRMHDCCFDNPDRMQSFLDALEATRLLEDLLFSDLKFNYRLQNPVTSRRIHLSKLRSIAFHRLNGDNPSAVEPNLLAHISLPSQLALTVTSSHFYCLHKVLGSLTIRRNSISDATSLVVAFQDLSWCKLSIISPSSAWQLERCRMPYPDSVLNIAGVLHMARQLWISFSGSEVRPDGRNQTRDVLRAWLGTHNFEEVVLSGWQTYSLGFCWFLQAFLGEQDSVPFRSLYTLCIHGASDAVWDPLVETIRRREMLGYPLQNLVFNISKRAPECEQATFKSWKQRAPNGFRSVGKILFLEMDEYPRPRLPPICAPRDSGQWKWFDWSHVGDIGSG